LSYGLVTKHSPLNEKMWYDAWIFVSSDPVKRFGFIFFGSLVMYLFSLSKGFTGSVPALQRLMPGKKQVFYDRVDFGIVVVTGAVVGTLFFRPQDPLQALAAGLGWSSAINVLVTQHKPLKGESGEGA
jgi:hypothetical protein